VDQRLPEYYCGNLLAACSKGRATDSAKMVQWFESWKTTTIDSVTGRVTSEQ
jgi:hypothetical protein